MLLNKKIKKSIYVPLSPQYIIQRVCQIDSGYFAFDANPCSGGSIALFSYIINGVSEYNYAESSFVSVIPGKKDGYTLKDGGKGCNNCDCKVVGKFPVNTIKKLKKKNLKKQKFRKYVRKPKKFKPKKKQSKESKESKELKELASEESEVMKKANESEESEEIEALRENFSVKSGWDKFKLILYIVLIGILGCVLYRGYRFYKNVT